MQSSTIRSEVDTGNVVVCTCTYDINLPPIIGSGVRLIFFCNKGLRRSLLLNRSMLPPKLGSEGLLPFVVVIGGGGCMTFRFRILCEEEEDWDEGAMMNTGESSCCCCCIWW